ncbi:MAG: HEPN domain-containing protein [Bacteroidia bacterium]|jgi:uncharacterized protein (UPF0332 family)
MIANNDRDAIIEYRIKQAIETIELSKFLLSSGKLAISVNRIYYGIYYALSALALKNSFETSKHSHLIGWFNKEFIANSKVDPKYGKILRNAYQNRTKGDYDAFVNFSTNEVESMLNEMVDFINEIHNLLNV